MDWSRTLALLHRFHNFLKCDRGEVAVSSTGTWVRGFASTSISHLSPYASYSKVISSSSSTLSLAPSSAPSSMRAPSYSSSYLCSAPLKTSSLYDPPTRRSWSDTGGNWALLHLAIVACKSPSIPYPKLAHMLRLPQASISMALVRNRIHLARRQWIISPTSAWNNQGALSRAMRR